MVSGVAISIELISSINRSLWLDDVELGGGVVYGDGVVYGGGVGNGAACGSNVADEV